MGTTFGFFAESFAPTPDPGRSDHGGQHPGPDAVSTYFECITSCSIDDGECVTRCVEILREEA